MRKTCRVNGMQVAICSSETITIYMNIHIGRATVSNLEEKDTSTQYKKKDSLISVGSTKGIAVWLTKPLISAVQLLNEVWNLWKFAEDAPLTYFTSTDMGRKGERDIEMHSIDLQLTLSCCMNVFCFFFPKKLYMLLHMLNVSLHQWLKQ